MQHFQVRMPRQQLNLTPSNSIIAILLRIMQSVHTHRASISLLTISSLPFLYYLFHPKKKKLLLKKLDKLWREFQRFEPRNISYESLRKLFQDHFLRPIASSLQEDEEDSLLSSSLSLYCPHGVPFLFKTLESCSILLRVYISSRSDLLENESITQFLTDINALEQRRLHKNSIPNDKIVLSLEGLKKSGKSSLAHTISSHCNGKVLDFPKKALAVQSMFLPPTVPLYVKMAFDYLCNYLLAEEMIDSSETLICISDYYHQSLVRAFLLASKEKEDKEEEKAEEGHHHHEEAELANLPSSAFEWPTDLPIPSLVIFLAASSEVRASRRRASLVSLNANIGGNGSLREDSSSLLGEDDLESVNHHRDSYTQAVYSYVFGASVVAIDASAGSVEEVFAIALEACYEYSIDLYPLCKPPSPIKRRTTDEDTFGEDGLSQRPDLTKRTGSGRSITNMRVSMGVYGGLGDVEW